MKQQSHKISARWVKDHISIIDLLANLGYPPPKPTGKERYYNSPLRDDPTPSFCVDDRQGIWYDHGEGKGGNIIDFGKLFWNELSFPEVLEKIVTVSQAYMPTEQLQFQRRVHIPTVPNYGLLEIKELGHNTVLLNYLERRGIRAVAEGRTKEVYYYIEDENKIRKNYFAVGWQNETGNWCIRNANYKGCLGSNAISFLPGSEKRLAVFEGYMNYLSWLTDNPFATESILVLNSISLIQPGIIKAQSYNDVYLFFDHDPPGERATTVFKQALPQAIDCSGIYKGYNDYNDKIVADMGGYQLNR
jgi:hypothetical protein